MKKLVLSIFLAGSLIGGKLFSQESQSSDFIIEYDSRNSLSQIEEKAKSLLLVDFPNIQKTGKFEKTVNSYLNANGHPSLSQIKETSNFPTEITSIIFPKDYFSDDQVARESVVILKDLLKEHGYYGVKNEDFKEFDVRTKIEGENLKVIIFVSE
jgi:hypothetical protein